MNTTNIFQYIKEKLESDAIIQEIIGGQIYPIAIMRDVKLPYIIQNAKLNSVDTTKDGEFEREIISTIAVFGESQDVPIKVIAKMEQLFSGNVEKVDYLDVSNITINSWDFDERDGVFGGVIELTIKIDV